eukprot:Opistho-2@78522
MHPALCSPFPLLLQARKHPSCMIALYRPSPAAESSRKVISNWWMPPPIISCVVWLSSRSRRAIVEQWGLAPVVGLVVHDNSYIQELALTCLSNLALDGGNKERILAANALPHIISCCSGSQNHDNRILSCHCLQELAAHSAKNALAIAHAGAIEPLVECTKSGNEALQRAAAKAIWHLLGPDDTKARVAANAGAGGSGSIVLPLLSMARSTSSDLQLPAVGCLWELCTCGDMRTQIAAERDAVATIVDLTESADTAVQLFSCLAIAFLSLSAPLRPQLDGCGALGRVDAFVSRCREALNTQDVDWGVGHFAHMRALVVSRQPVCRRLAVLCICHLSAKAAYLDCMLDANLLVPIRHAATCGDVDVQRLSLRALSNLISGTSRGSEFLGALCALSNDWAALLASGRGADVSMLVGGSEEPSVERLAAHSLVLSTRSDYFRAMFSAGGIASGASGGQWLEHSNGCVRVPDHSPRVFECALEYLYTGAISTESLFADGPATCAQLLLLADKYGIEGLRATCESLLLPRIEIANVCMLCDIADRGNAARLRSRCVTFIVQRLQVVLATEGFSKIYQNNASLVMEILRRVAPLVTTDTNSDGTVQEPLKDNDGTSQNSCAKFAAF